MSTTPKPFLGIEWTRNMILFWVGFLFVLIAVAGVGNYFRRQPAGNGLRDYSAGADTAPSLNAQVRTNIQGIQITNTDSFAYEDVRVIINPMAGTYRASYGRIEPGESRNMPLSEFTDSNNERFDFFKTKPSHVMLNCRAMGRPVSEEYRFKQ